MSAEMGEICDRPRNDVVAALTRVASPKSNHGLDPVGSAENVVSPLQKMWSRVSVSSTYAFVA
jgi:hypothetical protein